FAYNIPRLPSFMASASNTIASAVTTTNSVFLTQSTALVGVPAGAQPDQTGGGVWARAVGGEVDLARGDDDRFRTRLCPIVKWSGCLQRSGPFELWRHSGRRGRREPECE